MYIDLCINIGKMLYLVTCHCMTKWANKVIVASYCVIDVNLLLQLYDIYLIRINDD